MLTRDACTCENIAIHGKQNNSVIIVDVAQQIQCQQYRTRANHEIPGSQDGDREDMESMRNSVVPIMVGSLGGLTKALPVTMHCIGELGRVQYTEIATTGN